MNLLHRLICLALSCLLLAISVIPARASAPLYVPLCQMIARAEAVALVRIERIEVIERPKDLPNVWYPNQTVTLHVVEGIRGDLPKSFKARVEIKAYRNPSARVDAAVLVFVGQMNPRDDSVSVETKRLDGHKYLFEASQGFIPVADLVRLNDEKLGAKALDAIKEAVRRYRPREKPDRGTLLNDETAAPFFKLLESDRPELRAWAVEKGLDYAQVTPFVAQELSKALSHTDRAVNKAAARHFMRSRYLPASDKLRGYLAKLPKEEARLTKEIQAYLQGRLLLAHLEGMDEKLAVRLGKTLTESRTRGSAAGIDLRFDKRGKLEVVPYSSNGDDDALEALREHVEKLDVAKLEVVPYQFHVSLWLEKDKVKFEGQEHDF